MKGGRVVVVVRVEITNFDGRDFDGRPMSDDKVLETIIDWAMKAPESFFDGADWQLEREPRG